MLLIRGVASDILSAQQVEFDELVELLGSDSYHTRRAASRKLIDASIQSNVDDLGTTDALQRGLVHRSLEVRLGCREILNAVKQNETDHQVSQLLNPRVDASAIQLPGWNRVSPILGDDMPARRTFAMLAQNHPLQAKLLSADVSVALARAELAKMDPYRISPDDIQQWMMLLLLETVYASDHPANLTSRSYTSLSSPHLGPKARTSDDQVVLTRLVDQWIVVHQNRCPARERLLIAMRYGCHQRTEQICRQVFSDALAPPATQVMAMLCASATKLSDRETHLRSRLSDKRTAHVWQLIASRKTKIRTQVRDVALALLLHEQGIDPRTVGFSELQADPVLVFRDHSLGFPGDTDRIETHARGTAKLAK